MRRAGALPSTSRPASEHGPQPEVIVNICASELVEHPQRFLHPLPLSANTIRRRVLAVGVIGPGRVGSALLAQLRAAQPRLARDSGLELKLCGVVARKRMW